MFRQKIIFRLERRIENLEIILKKKYDANALCQWQNLQKEVEIQKAYIQAEA